MIISHEHKFIFLHARKVAGSSIKASLAQFLGPLDEMYGGWVEVLKNGGGPNRWALEQISNHRVKLSKICWDRNIDSYGAFLNRGIKICHLHRFGVNPAHLPAVEVKRFFLKEWCNYRKVVFKRDPFEQLVSDYLWRCRHSREIGSFEDFLKGKPFQNPKFFHLLKFSPRAIFSNEAIAFSAGDVDFVGDYGNLEEDFRSLLDFLDLPRTRLFDNGKVFEKRVDYAAYYQSSRAVELAQSLLKSEYKL